MTLRQIRSLQGGGASSEGSLRTRAPTTSQARPTSATTRLSDWALHWPFPEFDSAARSRGTQRSTSLPEAAPSPDARTWCSHPRAGGSTDSIHNNDDVDSDGDDRPPEQVPVHPLCSEWVAAPAGAVRSTVSRSPSEQDTTFGDADVESKQSISKDEITALLSVYDPANLVASEVDMQHIDCSWLTRHTKGARIVPPALHLHLGNLSNELDAPTIRPRQTLINSPRSAIILMRNGVAVRDLLRDPRGLPSATAALADLSWAQKKQLAVERARQRRLEALVQEYRRLDPARCSFEHVVVFCAAFDARRPSTALAVPFATDTRPVTPLDRLPTELSRRRAEALRASVEGRLERATRCRLKRQQHEQLLRDRAVSKQLQRQERLAQRRAECIEVRRARSTVAEGRRALWRLQQDASSHVTGFRRLVLREQVQRRADEAARIQEELAAESRELQGWVRHVRLQHARRREAGDVLDRSHARRTFLSTTPQL